MEVSQRLLDVYHQQKEETIKVIFYILSFSIIIGYSTDMIYTFNHNEIIPGYLNLYQIVITIVSCLLFLSKKINIHNASAIIIYSQLFVAIFSILYFGVTNSLQENRYLVELILQLVFIAMIGYLMAPKHSIFYGSIATIIVVILNIVYWGDSTFDFLPIYIPVLVGFTIGLHIIIRNTIISFSQNYLNTIALQRQAEDIKKQNIKINQLNQFRKDLSAMVVHDLKNPLNIILSKSNNSMVLRSGKKMLSLIMNILDIEKHESNEFPLNFEYYSINKEIQSVVSDLELLTEEKNITINCSIDNFDVYADKRVINRVMENLLTNAIRHSLKNNIISVITRNNNDKNIRVEVINYGKNIPENRLNSIFDKYTQLENEDSFATNNTGLGLTFCKIAVQAHGQNITAKNLHGKGVVFEFTLSKKARPINSTNYYSSKKNTSFTIDEKLVIQQFTKQLKYHQVHNASEILDILENIPDTTTQITKWKNRIKSSVFSANNLLYNQLINSI